MKTNKPFIISVAVLVLIALGYVLSGGAVVQNPVKGNPSAAQGKLNINAICEGALAYMSFPDGATADAFMTDCKEGKHSEVIERYKADMNLGDGALY